MQKITAIRTTFKAYERLKREQHIDALFRNGKALSVFPLRLLYLKTCKSNNEIAPVRIGFSVPKRKFKKAVVRNRFKRLLREAWRLQKKGFYNTIATETQFHIFLIYTGDAQQKLDTIQQSLLKAIEQLKKQN